MLIIIETKASYLVIINYMTAKAEKTHSRIRQSVTFLKRSLQCSSSFKEMLTLQFTFTRPLTH